MCCGCANYKQIPMTPDTLKLEFDHDPDNNWNATRVRWGFGWKLK